MEYFIQRKKIILWRHILLKSRYSCHCLGTMIVGLGYELLWPAEENRWWRGGVDCDYFEGWSPETLTTVSVLSWKCVAIIKEPGKWKAEAIPYTALKKCGGLGRGRKEKIPSLSRNTTPSPSSWSNSSLSEKGESKHQHSKVHQWVKIYTTSSSPLLPMIIKYSYH